MSIIFNSRHDYHHKNICIINGTINIIVILDVIVYYHQIRHYSITRACYSFFRCSHTNNLNTNNYRYFSILPSFNHNQNRKL